MTTVFGIFGSGLRSAHRDEDRLLLGLVAQNLLERSRLDLNPLGGPHSGDIGGGLRWQIDSEPYVVPDNILPPPTTARDNAGPSPLGGDKDSSRANGQSGLSTSRDDSGLSSNGTGASRSTLSDQSGSNQSGFGSGSSSGFGSESGSGGLDRDWAPAPGLDSGPGPASGRVLGVGVQLGVGVWRSGQACRKGEDQAAPGAGHRGEGRSTLRADRADHGAAAEAHDPVQLLSWNPAVNSARQR